MSIALLACGAAPHSGTPARDAKTTHFVFMRNHKGADEFVYSPHVITVRPGTRVVWINRSVQPHTVTSKARHPVFDSGTQKLINPKHQFSFVFHHTGRFAYYCLLHPYMTGVVIVRS